MSWTWKQAEYMAVCLNFCFETDYLENQRRETHHILLNLKNSSFNVTGDLALDSILFSNLHINNLRISSGIFPKKESINKHILSPVTAPAILRIRIGSYLTRFTFECEVENAYTKREHQL